MVSYEIRIGGTVPPGLVEGLAEKVSAIQPAGTTLEVVVPDDAALWGLIDALRDAGADLLEIRRHNEDPPES
ncbi:hypothetical protein [Microlunatus ginsengisoli]|uniref:Uncharacterized protein n=1 Tax=Microlunatus ginsengisoli TaxID=363863 RepID=A0ABP6ZJ33_9ACTN